MACRIIIADEKFGTWHLEVAEPGDYIIELRRYPREADLPINASVKATPVADGRFVAGRALAAAEARLRIGRHDETRKLPDGAKEATFRVKLAKGPIELDTVFRDADARELCGAYYAYVRRE